MDNKDIMLITAILELLLKYGVPATIEMIKTMQTNNPTIEDIKALADRVPHPDTYEEV